MSNSKPNPSAIKSWNGFEEGGYYARKGRQCQIKKIHFEMNPPAVTVYMFDTESEVGTEFDRLQHVNTWTCSMCTAENQHASHKCEFCKYARNYKETFTVCREAEIPEKRESEAVVPPEESETMDDSVDTAPEVAEAQEISSQTPCETASESDEQTEPDLNQKAEECDEYEESESEDTDGEAEDDEVEDGWCHKGYYRPYNSHVPQYAHPRKCANTRRGMNFGRPQQVPRTSRRPMRPNEPMPRVQRPLRRSDPFFGCDWPGNFFGSRWM